ncbi:hypothetical protein [Halosegnis longus]|uniref:hypothetical protein n=1 Tax=Halosegnis longus TaxID=2216012 RepID=UPI00129DD2F6|nr:hypothetical protein [Halosegnis longus]
MSAETRTTIVAQCSDCGDEHPNGDRPVYYGPDEYDPDEQLTTTATKCPVCGCPTYTTSVAVDETVKPVDERIADAVDVHGVGAETQSNIVQHFDGWRSFCQADMDELRTIDGVGKSNGERIIEAQPDVND